MTGELSPWTDDVPLIGTRRLLPDPKYIEAIGRNHDLESAVADLIDNSVDALATHVLVRIIRDSEMLRALCVVDDGGGINPDQMDRAMTIGARRSYLDSDLGYFGIGMKAASLGQAEKLTVLSRSKDGVSGRVWLKEQAAKDFECGVVEQSFAETELDRDWSPVTSGTGTIVRWDGVRAFPSVPDSTVADRVAEHLVLKLRQHLGLTFHRVIVERSVTIAIDVEDVSSNETPTTTEVAPIDPFGYTNSPVPGYPRTLSGSIGEVPLSLECHIWSTRSQLQGFRLPGKSPSDFQGFFFYRNGRLLQAGGWNHAAINSPKLQLARTAINLDDSLVPLFPPNPEKTAITTPSGFADVIRSTTDPDGITFADYLQSAEVAYTHSRRRSRTRRKVVPPGRGFAPAVRRKIGDELEFLPGEEHIDVVWESLSDERFFDVDLDLRRVVLNRRYRWALVGEASGSLNDSPLLKALLYLLIEQVFAGEYLGPKDKDDIALYQAILTAAAELEVE